MKHIREVVGDNPVYITLDIDVLDPAYAPAYVLPISDAYIVIKLTYTDILGLERKYRNLQLPLVENDHDVFV